MALFFTPRLEIFVYLWRECGCWTAGWESRGGLGKGSRVLGAGGQHCPVSTLSRENMVRPWDSGSRPAPPQGPGTSLLEVIITPGSLGDTWCHLASDITGQRVSIASYNRHIIVSREMKPSRLLSPAARTLLSPSAGGLGGWLAILARAQSADHQGPGHSSGSGLPTQICRHWLQMSANQILQIVCDSQHSHRGIFQSNLCCHQHSETPNKIPLCLFNWPPFMNSKYFYDQISKYFSMLQ